MDKYKITENEKVSGVVAAPNTLTDTAQNNKQVFDRLPKLIADKFNDFVDAVVKKFTGYYTKEETNEEIKKLMSAIGKGDMVADVYDTDKDGTVNDSDCLGGIPAGDYAKVTETMMKANFEFDEATGTLNITL